MVGSIEQHRMSKESELELLSRKRDEEELETIVVFSETKPDFQFFIDCFGSWSIQPLISTRF